MNDTTQPLLLDLFCCEGGAAVGYQRAGFRVLGVDLERRFVKRYPGWFHQGDALATLEHLLTGGRIADYTLSDFAGVHASPPCQAYTRGNAGYVTTWPKLIAPVRALLVETGLPYVIENVKGAAPELIDPTLLCGCMFDLSTIDTDGVRVYLQRARLFETSWDLKAPRPCDHSAHKWVAGVYGGARRDKYEAKYDRKGGYVPRDKAVAAALLGIEHDMTWNGLFESIPPAYAQHVGASLLEHLGRVSA